MLILFLGFTLAIQVQAQEATIFSKEPADISGNQISAGTKAESIVIPVITGVDPDHATIPELLTVEISGSGTYFSQGSLTSVWFSMGSSSIYPYSYFAVNNELIQASFSFTNYNFPGSYTVNTYDYIDGHLSLADAFELFADPNGPHITDIAPDTATIPESLSVTISGENTHFMQGSSTSVWFEQASQTIYPLDLSIQSDTKIEAVFDFKYYHLPGDYNVWGYNPVDGTMLLPDAFTLLPNPDPPQITDIDPEVGHQGDSLEVAISGQGTHFSEGSFTVMFLQGSATLPPYEVEVLDDDHANAKLYISNYAFLGHYNFEYFSGNYGSVTVPYAFTVLPPAPPSPEIVSMNPDEGFQAIEIIMAVVGNNTHFLSSGNLDVWFGMDTITLQVDTIMPFSEEGFVIQFMFPYTVPVGDWFLNVYNDEDGQIVAENPFLLKESPDHPGIVSIEPGYAAVGEQSFITIEAVNSHFAKIGLVSEAWLEKGFIAIDGEGETPDGNTTLNANFSIPADADTGWYDLHIYNDFDGQMVLPDAFRVADSIDIIPENFSTPEIQIYPNPGKGIFSLTISTSSETEVTVYIIDAAGRKRHLVHHEKTAFLNEKLDLTGLPEGIYYLQIITEKGIPATRKLIISM